MGRFQGGNVATMQRANGYKEQWRTGDDWKICGNRGGRPLIMRLLLEGICHELQPFRFAREDTRLYTREVESGRAPFAVTRCRGGCPQPQAWTYAVRDHMRPYNIMSQLLWPASFQASWSEQAKNLSLVPSAWRVSLRQMR